MKSILKAFIIATLAAIGFGAVCFILLPPMAKVYLWPGMYIGGIVARVIPSALIYAIAPDGGGPAFVLIAATCSIIFWACAFAGVYTAFKRISR
jgi:hypothetical protein